MVKIRKKTRKKSRKKKSRKRYVYTKKQYESGGRNAYKCMGSVYVALFAYHEFQFSY